MKNAFDGQGRAEGSSISSVDTYRADDKRENDCEDT